MIERGVPICYDHLRNHPFFTLATSDKGELEEDTPPSSSSSSSLSRASPGPGLLSASASSATVAPPVPAAVGVAPSSPTPTCPITTSTSTSTSTSGSSSGSGGGSGGLALVSESSLLGPAVRVPLLSELCVNACGRACMVVAEAVAQVRGCVVYVRGSDVHV